MAQTAPKRNRRPLNFRTQYQPQLYIVLFQTIVSAHVISVGFSTETDGPLDTSDLTIAGIPGWVLNDGQELTHFAKATSPAGAYLATFNGAEIAEGNYLLTAAWDSTLRWSNGGYVAPGRTIAFT